MCLPLVKGPKVMGQLASQLFHGQVCVIPSLSQLQWADKRSRVHFKCAICIWNLLLSTVKMRSKELSLSVKQAIIRLKKTKETYRRDSKNIRRGQNNSLEHSQIEGTHLWAQQHQKTRKTTENNCGGWPKNPSLVKKTPLTTVGQIKNTLLEVGVSVSESTIKRRLHQLNTEGSPQDVNHQWAPKTGRPD